jgi:transcription antitermination factor NusG
MLETITSSDAASNGLKPPKVWVAVFTIPRHEKRVEEHLTVREIESFLPLYQTMCKWKNGTKKMLQLPLFSSYIFVRIDSSGYRPVLAVPGVISIIGRSGVRLPVSDSYIHCLREGLCRGKIEPYRSIPEGARVRIRSGVMAGMEGILLRKKNNCRVVLTLELIMKSITVEVEADNIEPADSPSKTHPYWLPATA